MATSKRREALGGSNLERSDPRATRVAALDFLARRDRSSADLRRKLVDKGYDPAIVGAVIEHLCTARLLDDRRYVENFVGFHAARGQGPLRVRAELRAVGMQGELVEEAIDAYPGWIEQLGKARQKKFGTQRPTHYADRRRQAQFLTYRGFTGAQIRMALGFDTDLDVDTNI